MVVTDHTLHACRTRGLMEVTGQTFVVGPVFGSRPPVDTGELLISWERAMMLIQREHYKRDITVRGFGGDLTKGLARLIKTESVYRRWSKGPSSGFRRDLKSKRWIEVDVKYNFASWPGTRA